MKNMSCREITQKDIPNVISCLARNFPKRSRSFWARSVKAIIDYSEMIDSPRVGNVLLSGNDIVGVILTIYHIDDGKIFCNLSSWCTDPEYRGYATILARFTSKDKSITYTNLSAAPHTHTTIELFKFKRYAEGQMTSIPLLSNTNNAARIIPFDNNLPESMFLSSKDRKILTDHKKLGMQTLIGIIGDKHVPIILKWLPLWKYIVPTAQLIYCQNQIDLQIFAKSIGYYCLRHGRLRLLVNSNSLIPGLFGIYQSNKKPLYFRGPNTPNPLDLSYSELVLLK